VSKESVLRFISERIAAVDGYSVRQEAERLLWELLKILVTHQGNLRENSENGSEAGTEKAILELLASRNASFVGADKAEVPLSLSMYSLLSLFLSLPISLSLSLSVALRNLCLRAQAPVQARPPDPTAFAEIHRRLLAGHAKEV
jgi:hypothetical protein